MIKLSGPAFSVLETAGAAIFFTISRGTCSKCIEFVLGWIVFVTGEQYQRSGDAGRLF
jgi:hypothetical protein